MPASWFRISSTFSTCSGKTQINAWMQVAYIPLQRSEASVRSNAEEGEFRFQLPLPLTRTPLEGSAGDVREPHAHGRFASQFPANPRGTQLKYREERRHAIAKRFQAASLGLSCRRNASTPLGGILGNR